MSDLQTWLAMLAWRYAMRRQLRTHCPPSGGGSFDRCIYAREGKEQCHACDKTTAEAVYTWMATESCR